MKAAFRLTNIKRFTAMAVLAAVLVIMLFSSCYVIMEANHHCSGSSCPTCARIEQCTLNIRQIGTGKIAVIAAIAAVCFFLHALRIAVSAVPAETPISRKVRMNN